MKNFAFNFVNYSIKLVKNDVTVINKKDLNGFMKFASEEARKCLTDNMSCVCVDDKTVFGWAMHYFEEDSIEGNLYNEDGTEYKPIKEIKIQKTRLSNLNPKKKINNLLFLIFLRRTLQPKILKKNKLLKKKVVKYNKKKLYKKMYRKIYKKFV